MLVEKAVLLLAKERSSSIASAESVIGVEWGEERRGIAWVSKHHGSEDERAEVGMGCGLRRLKQLLETKACTETMNTLFYADCLTAV